MVRTGEWWGVSGLRLVFGERLDGGAWPPVVEGGLLGSAVVGPAGLLSLVETFAGLAGPSVPVARRIAAIRRRLASLTGRPYFWSESFKVDPWAVAREILGWRDELVQAGWTPKAIANPPLRLADLAELENLAEPPLPPGMADRFVVAAKAVGPSVDLPFEEIVAVEGALSTEDEVGMLIDQMPGWVGKAVSKILQSKETVSSYSLPLLVFEKQTAKFLDAFIKRDSLKFVDSGTLRLVEHLPTIIPALPSIYQKLYTKFLRATCSRCKLPAKAPVICLLCGQVLCCNEAPIHFNTECAKSSFGVFLLLATSIVHIFSGDGVAQWGSLYLDSHGEEDPGLSKPLTLSLERVAVLRAEIRENSWIWRRGAKSLVWRPAG